MSGEESMQNHQLKGAVYNRDLHCLTWPFKKTVAWLPLLVTSLLVTGCAVGPDYRSPDVSMPESWSEQSTDKAVIAPVSIAQWWKAFNDPALDSLIAQAVESNHDLRIAEARIREARALHRVAAADLWPNVNTSGSYSRSRRSIGNTSIPQAAPVERNLFQTGFDASWEVDVFGGSRRATEAAKADIDAAVENRRDTQITLLAEVARNYIEVRGLQRRLDIFLASVQMQEDAVAIIQAKYKAGLISELDAVQAESLLASTKAQIPALENSIKQTIHRIGVLVGKNPGDMTFSLLQKKPIPISTAEIPPGLPSDLLRRRPDVRYAERSLAAATARIGVAKADLFPRFSLTGNFGLQAEELSVFTMTGISRYWSFGPTIRWPIFAAGRIRANIRAQGERQTQSLLTYEKTVLLALEDVENALVACETEQVRRRNLSEAVAASQRSVELASELYTKGMTGFLNVLDARRSLLQTEDELALSERAVSQNLVFLYKALGGGWEAGG